MENTLVKEKTEQLTLELPLQAQHYLNQYQRENNLNATQVICKALRALQQKEAKERASYARLAAEMQAQYEAAPDKSLDEVLIYTQW